MWIGEDLNITNASLILFSRIAETNQGIDFVIFSEIDKYESLDPEIPNLLEHFHVIYSICSFCEYTTHMGWV